MARQLSKAWSAREIARLLNLYKEQRERGCIVWREIVAAMPGRNYAQCVAKFTYETHSRGKHIKNNRRGLTGDQSAGFKAPHEVLVEAHSRRALTHLSLTARICGDPLPGYSALDRKTPNVGAISLPQIAFMSRT